MTHLRNPNEMYEDNEGALTRFHDTMAEIRGGEFESYAWSGEGQMKIKAAANRYCTELEALWGVPFDWVFSATAGVLFYYKDQPR